MTNVRSFWLRVRGGAAMINPVDDNSNVVGSHPSSSSSSSSSSGNINGTSTAATTKGLLQQSRRNTPVANYDLNLYAYETSFCAVQGIRHEMEDEFFVSNRGDFGAVFDGHGGPAVSKYLRQNLFARLQSALPPSTTGASMGATKGGLVSVTVEDYVQALFTAIDKVDDEVQRIKHWSFQGSTLVAVWLHQQQTVIPEYNNQNNNNNNDNNDNNADNDDDDDMLPRITKTTIIAANVGDSRAVLSRNGTAIDLTKDHKPDDPDELIRIEAAGAKVTWCQESGLFRINGNMALSRAVGDQSERPWVTSEPEITVTPMVVEQDEFIVVATDGLWDVMTSDEVVEMIHYLLLQIEPESIADYVVREALSRGTTDNVTVVIMFLRSRHRLSTSTHHHHHHHHQQQQQQQE